MRPPAPWKNDFKINKLQRERDHWRHEAQQANTSIMGKIIQSKKVIHRMFSPNPETLKVEPESLTNFSTKQQND